jgi:hypothetical protein
MIDTQKQALQLLHDNLYIMNSDQVNLLIKFECLVPDMNFIPFRVIVPDSITEENANIVINWLKDGDKWNSLPKFRKMKVQIDYHIDGTIEIEANDFGDAEEIFCNLGDDEKINGLFLEEPCIDEIKECCK